MLVSFYAMSNQKQRYNISAEEWLTTTQNLQDVDM
mgnify:CR=1 FL=1